MDKGFKGGLRMRRGLGKQDIVISYVSVNKYRHLTGEDMSANNH